MTSAGDLAMVYMPTMRPITVNLAALKGSVRARWFDPTNGAYQDISGSPFAGSGSHEFTPPGKDHDGDGDWVLVLDVL